MSEYIGEYAVSVNGSFVVIAMGHLRTNVESTSIPHDRIRRVVVSFRYEAHHTLSYWRCEICTDMGIVDLIFEHDERALAERAAEAIRAAVAEARQFDPPVAMPQGSAEVRVTESWPVTQEESCIHLESGALELVVNPFEEGGEVMCLEAHPTTERPEPNGCSVIGSDAVMTEAMAEALIAALRHKLDRYRRRG